MPLFCSDTIQILLDMVENYPTALRTLILAENNISPELQQQISDLLSEGEEEDETVPHEVMAREKNSWICQSSKIGSLLRMGGDTVWEIYTHVELGYCVFLSFDLFGKR